MKNLLMTLAAAFTLTASAQPTSNAGYTIEMDFKVDNGSAGVIFACPNVSNFYMWQINLENPSNPKFRPHRWVDGSAALLEEFEIGDKVNLTTGREHKLKVVIDNYNSATTYIDDVIVDENRAGDYPYGMIGFRQSFANGSPEVAYFDNIKVTRHEDGKLKMDEDFSADNPFDRGELVDGWFKAEGVMDGENRFFGCPYNDVHFALECEVNLVKDDVAVVFAQPSRDDETYYMWALNCFDRENPLIRHHKFTNGGLDWFNDSEFTQFSKSEILGQDRKLKIEVVGAYIYTYIDGILVDRYMDWNDHLRPGLVGFRIDTKNEQQDDAWIDNVKVTVYDAEDNPTVVLQEDFSNPNLCWFPEAIIEEKGGDRKMHIYGEKVLYKWMQLSELAEDAGYTISTDFEIGLYNVGLCFAGSKDLQNFYMWQVNTVDPNKPMLRPHKWTNGNPALFGEEIELPVGLNLNEGTHNLKLVITNNANCATYIDGRLVDNRSGIFEEGLIGFREDRVDEKQSIESGYYDNVVITSNADDSVIYSCDFSNGNPFSNGTLTEDGRLFFKGSMSGTQYAWQCDWNDVWYTVEADMTLMKDDVAFIFSHIDDGNYYMWSIDAFDRNEMMIRAHIFENGGVRFDDISFFNFSKEEMLETQHHVKIEVRGALIRTYIDDEIVNNYVSFSDKLVGGQPIGIRIDTSSEQNDDAYIDNIKVTEYELAEPSPADSRKRAASLKSNTVLEENFEDPKNTWFPDAVVETYNGSNQLHIYTPEKNNGGEGALIKLMQAEAPGFSTGVIGIESESKESRTEYFNLQGIRVANPQPGNIYIVRKGNQTYKQVIR